MPVHIAIILDGRRAKKMNKYPLKLGVNFGKKTKYYPTVFDLSKEDFGKLTAKRPSAELQKIRDQLNTIEVEARHIALELDPFTFAEFERDFAAQNRLIKYRRPKGDGFEQVELVDYTSFLTKFPILGEANIQANTVASIYLKYIKRLLREGRISTALTYHGSYASMKKFHLPERFSDITPTFLTQYEQWQLRQGLSKSTIGIYIRSLRCLFNEAIIDGIIKKEKCYPFGRRKYQIPTSRNIKKALSLSDVEKIINATLLI